MKGGSSARAREAARSLRRLRGSDKVILELEINEEQNKNGDDSEAIDNIHSGSASARLASTQPN